jgi:hypothetical protein
MRCFFFVAIVLFPSLRFANAQEPDSDAGSQRRIQQLSLWDSIRQALQAPDGAKYFETSLQGAMIPANVNGVVALRGTVISSEPPEHPAIVTVAMSDGAVAEVTLKLVDDPEPPAFRQEPVTGVLPIQVQPAYGIAAHDNTVEDMIREWRARPLASVWRLAPQEPRALVRTAATSATLTDSFPTGADIEFEGLAAEFSREPFMLTFEVRRSKVTIVRAKK